MTSIEKRNRRGLSLIGLGAASLLGDAQAAIVYSGALSQTISATGGQDSFLIDLDGDGTDELDFYGCAGGNGTFAEVHLEGLVAGTGLAQSGFNPQLFNADELIDSGATFDTGAGAVSALAAYDTKDYGGAWAPPTVRGYAGVSFDVGGNTHYAWLDISVTDLTASFGSPASFSSTLYGYAWDDTPGAGIEAGDTGPAQAPVPGVLGLMAAGVGSALLARRLRPKSRSAAASRG